MPAGHGVRARTRDLFARPFRKKGYIPLSTYLRTFKVGDYVDVKVNGAIHKGMPHKFYHGRTGRIWNVTKRAVGVEVNKQIGNRIIRKRIHVRVEHVQQSRCAEEFKLRKKQNDELKAAAKARGETISTKRQPKGPKPGFMVEGYRHVAPNSSDFRKTLESSKMALSTVFRRASSTLATLAFRTARSPVSFRSGSGSAEGLILCSQLRRGSVSSFSLSRFSTESAITKTTADENLVSVIESEIECAVAEEAPHDNNILEDKPEGFPFEIMDTPGERTVLLQRKFEDETIQVEVDSAASYDDEEEANDDEADQESLGKVRIPMVVSVAKGDGVCLEFGVSAYPDEIVIDSLSIKQPQPEGSDNELAYEGPDFDDLDENLQKAFHRYLEIRGIKPSFTNFLADYVANKDSREYLRWLKDLKSFVEK